MKGLVVFYINHDSEKGQDPVKLMEITRNQNQSVIDKLLEEGWQVVFTPTTGESTRVERIVFEGE